MRKKRTTARARASARPKDMAGRPVEASLREVQDLYRRTKTLCGRQGLPPYMARNLRVSLAALYQVVNDGAVEFEHLYDLGV